jgi:TctA family transporter
MVLTMIPFLGAIVTCITALVLAVVLGDRAEDSFRQSMLLSQGSLTILWSNWLVGSITSLALLLLLWPFFGRGMQILKGMAMGSGTAATRGQR